MNKNLKKLVNIRAKAGGIDNRYRTDMTNNGFTSIPISESTAPPPISSWTHVLRSNNGVISLFPNYSVNDIQKLQAGKKFSIAFWYNLVTSGSYNMILNASGYRYTIQSLDLYDGSYYGVRLNHNYYTMKSNTILPQANKWTYVALVFDYPNAMLFLDGKLCAQYDMSSTSIDGESSPMFSFRYMGIGDSGIPHNFEINDFVILKDVVLWKSNFTPPTNYLLDDYIIADDQNQIKLY